MSRNQQVSSNNSSHKQSVSIQEETNNQLPEPNYIRTEETKDEELPIKKRGRLNKLVYKADVVTSSKLVAPSITKEISFENFSSLAKNCESLYSRMAYDMQLWLPPKRLCRLSFLTDILQGNKKVFTNQEICLFKTDDNLITVNEVLDQVKDSKQVLSYLPDNPKDNANNRTYLFAIVNTIDTTFFGRLVAERKKAQAQNKSSKQNKQVQLPIKVDAKLLELLEKSASTRIDSQTSRSGLRIMMTKKRTRQQFEIDHSVVKSSQQEIKQQQKRVPINAQQKS